MSLVLCLCACVAIKERDPNPYELALAVRGNKTQGTLLVSWDWQANRITSQQALNIPVDTINAVGLQNGSKQQFLFGANWENKGYLIQFAPDRPLQVVDLDGPQTLQRTESTDGLVFTESRKLFKQGIAMDTRLRNSDMQNYNRVILSDATTLNEDLLFGGNQSAWTSGGTPSGYVIFRLPRSGGDAEVIYRAEADSAVLLLASDQERVIGSQYPLGSLVNRSNSGKTRILVFGADGILERTVDTPLKGNAFFSRGFVWQEKFYLLSSEIYANEVINQLFSFNPEDHSLQRYGQPFSFWFQRDPKILADHMLLFNDTTEGVIHGVKYDLSSGNVVSQFAISISPTGIVESESEPISTKRKR